MNPNLDPDELVIGTEVELLITPPEGKEIDQLIINYENKTATIRNNKFTVRIERDLDIMIYFKQRYTSINLPEGVMLVNDSLDPNDLPVASNVALKVVEPSGKSLSSLKVNGEEIIDSLDEDEKFTVKVALNLTIEAIYSDTYHITYSINYGQFTITQEIAETTMVTEDFILEEAGDFDWKLNGEPFSFDRPFNYGRDITLTTIVEELPEENFTYDIVEGLAVIRSINNPENIKVIIIPDRLGEFFVGSTAHYDYSTSIFVRKNIVKYVKLPGLFQTLGDGAFVDESKLKEVKLSSSLTHINNWAFLRSGLEKLEIPSSVKHIGIGAFESTEIREVIFLNEENSELEYIDENAFNGTQITSFKLVNDTAFSLKAFDLAFKKFEVIEGSEKYSVDEHDVLYSLDGETLIFYPRGKSDLSYTVPEGVKRLGVGSFSDAKNLKEITLPTSLEEICDDVFFRIYGLETLNIPDDSELKTLGTNFIGHNDKIKTFKVTSKVENMGAYSFLGAAYLENIIVAEDNPHFKDIDGALHSKDGKTLIFVPRAKEGGYTINANVTTIGEKAFYFSRLTNINIPERVASIENNALNGMERIDYIIIPESVTHIDVSVTANRWRVFDVFAEAPSRPADWASDFGTGDYVRIHYQSYWEYDNEGVPKYFTVDMSNLPEELSLVTKNMELENMIIGQNVEFEVHFSEGKKIGEILANDEDITSTVVDNKFKYLIPFDELVFSVRIDNIIYTMSYVINNGDFIFQEEYVHNQIVTNEYILEETNIGEWFWSRYSCPFDFGTPYIYLRDFTVYARVDKVQEACINYEVVDNKATITAINTHPGCKVLILPERVNNYTIVGIADLESSVLNNENVVRHIRLPKTLTKIGNYAFAGEENIRTINFEDENNCQLTSIGDFAFSNTAIKTFKLVNDVDSIGKGAFFGCKNLERLEVIDNSERYQVVDDVLFSLDGKILINYPSAKLDESYIVPEGVLEIDYYAFEGTNLEYIIVPPTVTTIKGRARLKKV